MPFSLEMNLITQPFVLPLFEHAQPSVHVMLSMLQHGQISKLSLYALQLLDQKNRNTTTRRILEKKSSPHMINRSLHVLYINPSECLFQPPPMQMSGSVVPSHSNRHQRKCPDRSFRTRTTSYDVLRARTTSYSSALKFTPLPSSLADKRSTSTTHRLLPRWRTNGH